MGIFLGIDPGKSGGIVALHESGELHFAVKMPDTDAGLWKALSHVGSPTFAVIEFVRSSPQMGVTSAFTFGRGYGALCMALTASGIAFAEVVPRKWQDAMQCRTGGDKNISKAKAQQLFPVVKVTHALADALLIASYARQLKQF